MSKFFYYLLIALSIVGLLVAVFFLLNTFLGEGGDMAAIPSIACCMGSLFESALAWTIAKVLQYVTMRIEGLEDSSSDADDQQEPNDHFWGE